jgi:hypothetical protein
MENEMSVNTRKKENTFTAVTIVDGKLVFSFPHAGLASFTFDPDKASAANRSRAMKMGFKQRISNGAALSRDTETGESASSVDKRAAMLRLAEHLESGSDEWELRVAAPKKDDPGLLAAAMMRGLGKDEAGVKALIALTMAKKGLDETGALKYWQDTQQVQAAKTEIVAERAAARLATMKIADAEDILAEMMGEDEGDEDDEDEMAT